MKNQINFVITAYKEEKTVGKVIEAAIEALPNANIFVVAPDQATLDIAKQYASKNPQVQAIQDQNQGKPAAMNLIIEKLPSNLAIFTDGDLSITASSIQNLASQLSENTIITGKPVIEDGGVANNSFQAKMLNWWGQILFDIIHNIRKKSFQSNKTFLISGYLWGINFDGLKQIKLDPNMITEDEYITYYAAQKGLKFVYSENSPVAVKYPQTISDWLKQKVRTLGGSYQVKEVLKTQTRSLTQETSQGLKVIFQYPKNFQQWIWLFALLFFRTYAWIKAYISIVILKKGKKVWTRIESTK